METNKKPYLFRLGPLAFFPKQTEAQKQQAEQDTEEFNRNLLRLVVIFGYGLLCFILAKADEVGRMFTESRPLYHYLIFVAPLVFSIMDWRVIRQARKSGIHISRITRYFIFGVWLVSAAYYCIYIYSLIFK